MEKKIVFYQKKDSSPWPDKINEQFSIYTSKHGVIFFDKGSDKEIEFLNISSKLKLNLNRKIVLKCTGGDLYKHPFHYLSVFDNPKIFFQNESEYGEICKGCGKSMIGIGTIPKKNLILNYNYLNPKNDFIQLSGNSIPKIFIITRKLKVLMEEANLTGYQLIPCLKSDNANSYFSEGLELEHSIETEYYQLIINNKVNSPPYCGIVSDFISPCPNCKSHNGFYLSVEPCFSSKDLKELDFQAFNEYRSDNTGRFLIKSQREIISAKTLKLFIENNIRLLKYMTDPPVKYGVVDIVD